MDIEQRGECQKSNVMIHQGGTRFKGGAALGVTKKKRNWWVSSVGGKEDRVAAQPKKEQRTPKRPPFKGKKKSLKHLNGGPKKGGPFHLSKREEMTGIRGPMGK